MLPVNGFVGFGFTENMPGHLDAEQV